MECPHIPELSYGEFSKRLHEKVVAKRIPINGSMEVTARCNLNCVHCYINLPANDREAKAKELTYKEICDIIDQVVDEGCLWLLLTGGEPFIRPDFLDIYTHAKKEGMLITIFTNGTLITPRIADYLAEWRPFNVEITLYGRTGETYERVTRAPGSYERCMRGINLLLEQKIPLKLKAMVMTLNKHELLDMKNYAEGLGVEFRYDAMLNGRLDGSERFADLRLTPQEVVELDLADEKRSKSWQDFCERFWGPPCSPDDLYYCGAGLGSFHVDSYGYLTGCILSRTPNYDLRRGTFREGWYGPIAEMRQLKRTQKVKCQNCELLSLCGQCPGWAELEYGDPEIPVDYLCQIAHLRMKRLRLHKRRSVVIN